MREIRRTTYSATRPDLSCSLYLPVDAKQSISACKAFIDEANARAVKNGYGAYAYWVCEEELYRKFDDNGMFAEERKTTSVLELYPKDLKKYFSNS